MKDAVAVIARFAAVIAVALLLGLAPGVAGAQSAAVVGTPTNLTATPGVGAVYLDWTPPANAEYHFVAWLPVDAVAGDFRIRPVGDDGTATIAGLTPGRVYFFTVIAGRWEWSAADFGAKWSAWSEFVTATPLRAELPAAGASDGIASNSTTASAAVELILTIGNLPASLPAGSSVELYLEDDFQVPASIAPGSVYFRAANPVSAATAGGRLVAAAAPVTVGNGDYFGGGDDWAIRAPLPDFNTGADYDGFQGPAAGQSLQLVILKSAGIRNPSEEGAHSVGYSALGPAAAASAGPAANLGSDALRTYAKISLSDDSNIRGYRLTVTGSGFNNGTSAAVHVLADSDVTQDLAAMVAAGGEMEAQACVLIIREGHRVGVATVGSDDRVAITFEVTVPVFKPGAINYICMVDGEGRTSSTDVEVFTLEPTLRASPSSVAVGDVITLFAQDFPNPHAPLTSLRIAGVEVYSNVEEPSVRVRVQPSSISTDGSAAVTFDLPGSIRGTPLEGTVRIDAAWGDVREDTKITISGGPTLRLRAYRDIVMISEARANESIVLLGEGFGTGRNGYIDPENITLDGVPILVDDRSLNNAGRIEVSNAGQFTATVHLWSAEYGSHNPALVPGVHTIGVWDSNGFYGSATIVIKDPSLAVTPSSAGPNDTVTITGADWPARNDNSHAVVGNVEIEVEQFQYAVVPDANGSFSIKHRLSNYIAVPSTQQVRASYGAYTVYIVKLATFDVPAATVTVTPDEGRPGDEIRLSVAGMPADIVVSEITIDRTHVLGAQELQTNQDGAVTATVVIPAIDPGTYHVTVKAGRGYFQTIAIGVLTVLPAS